MAESYRARDPIHDTTLVYRALIAAMSRPGTVADVGWAAEGPLADPGDNVALALAETLLDAEVRYGITAGGALDDAIAGRTSSRPAAPERADYLFVRGDGEDAATLAALAAVKRGTLQQPEDGTTVLVRVEAIAEAPPSRADWVLRGPGIASAAGCAVQGLSSAIVAERARWNAEYPLGVDMILYAASGALAAWPRTTIIEEGRSIWAM